MNILILCIFALFIVCIFTYIFDNNEHMTSTEAVQIVASVYNADNMTVKNINLTGNATINGTLNAKNDAVVGGNIVMDGSNSWVLHTPDDNRKSLYIAPKKASDWDWSNQITIDNNSTLTASTLVTSNLKSPNASDIRTPVYILNTELGGAINVFNDTIEYPNPNDQLKWYVDYKDAYGGSGNDWFNTLFKGKYMTFKNLSNGQYLGVNNCQKGEKLTTLPNVDDRCTWRWKGSYLVPKCNAGLRINVYRTANELNNPNKVVLWDNGWKTWDCMFQLVPATF